MSKTIDTLVADIHHVLKTGEGYTKEIAEWVANDIKASLVRQLVDKKDRKSGGGLRLSGMGKPCERQLWYDQQDNLTTEELPPSTMNKFIFGDITESHILGLAMAAGHKVEGLQDMVTVFGIKGSRDCIIDGWLVDVKSASSFSFDKFKYHKLREDDAFGYISQISSYLYGSQDDPLLVEKNKAAFLVFDKQHAHITLDIYDLTEELQGKEAEVAQKKMVSTLKEPPARPKWPRKEYDRKTKTYNIAEEEEDWAHQKSGNRKLAMNCSYCHHKHNCWDGLRTFVTSSGPIYYTKVVREPTGNATEIKVNF